MFEAETPEIVGRYARIGGHRIYYEACGQGTPMVCLHTAGQHALQWRFVLPHFAQRGYRVIALDLPGHGKSLLSGFKPIRVLHEYAEIVWALCEGLALARPIVIGCSIGADIALDLGVHHGAAMRAAIVCEGAARTATFPEGAIRMSLEDAGVPSPGDQAYYGAIGASGSGIDDDRRQEIAWTSRARDPKILANDLLGWIGHDLRGRLGQVACPVLLVRGEEDFLVDRELVVATRAELPDAEFVELPGIGHFPHVESDALLDVVERFLRGRGL